MGSGQYYLGPDGEPVLATDVTIWAEKFDRDKRRVAWEQVGKKRVSTVFLGLDHRFGDGPPLIFETMVFEGESWADEFALRYATRQQALRGHMLGIAHARTAQCMSPHWIVLFPGGLGVD